jgi:uncharacterized protein with beta-barrel porin domain
LVAELHGRIRGSAPGPRTAIGAGRIKPGSVAAVVAEYLDSQQFFASKGAGTQRMRRGILERFRKANGDRPFAWVTDPVLGAVFQTLPGAGFIVNGATPAQNSALASAGAELRLTNGVSLLGKFDGEFASHSTTYGGTGTIRYRW